MTDVWVYIDESQAPQASGTGGDQPFWLGALILAQPIDSKIVENGLQTLRADPDAVGNALDEGTLARGYFHGSADSKNAHSAICKAIVDARIDASLSAAQWFFERDDGAMYEGARLHRLNALLTLISVLGDDYDVVSVSLARRMGSFGPTAVAEWPTYCAQTQRDRVVWAANGSRFPERFPRINAKLVEADHPGIQVCDFCLWALQRARLNRLTPSGDQRWLERLGLKVEMAGGAEGGASQHVHGRLGRGIERSALPIEHSIGARSVDALTNLEKWELIREIAADVHRAASIAGAHRRIGHLAELLQSVAARCENDEARADNGRTVSDLMEAFIRVCDTLPVYDPLDAAACARATEKRQVAASFLRPGPGLWVPNEFSLRAAAVLGPEERRRR